MATLIISYQTDVSVGRCDWLSTLLAGWRAMRRHRRMHRELAILSRKPPRLLRDMGLDPEAIYKALDGTGDEVGPAHLSRLLRGYDAARSRFLVGGHPALAEGVRAPFEKGL